MTRNLSWLIGAGVPCPKHELPTVVTQSGLQHVCVKPDCDYSVRLQGPLRGDPEMTKDDKEKRKSEIDQFVKTKQAAKNAPATNNKPKEHKVVEKTKTEKVKEDASLLSIAQIAAELGLDPKRARAKLRAAGQSATEGRWPKVKRDGKEHKMLVALLTPEPADDDEEDEEEEEE